MKRWINMLWITMCIMLLIGCGTATAPDVPKDTVTSAPTVVEAPPESTVKPVSPLPATSGTLVQPNDFSYLGAFHLPDDEERPCNFEYGGNAMTYNPARVGFG